MRVDGKYELQGELARGGMGVVYRARDLGTGRDVALKLIQAARLTDRQRERFRREGVTAAGLDHPGIVRVHSSGEHEGQPYLVQELVEDARPLDLVFRERSLDERVDLVLEAAEAVAYAHARGVIHRDLKPANLLVGSDGRVRVTDFGLALRPEDHHLTKTGELIGTPTHMAPEQFHRAVGLETPATDVWALGVILYQALTGELPFQGATMIELAGKIDAATPSSPSGIAPGVSPELERVCLRALHRSPAERYPDAVALAEALASTPRLGRGLRPYAALAALAALAGVSVAFAVGAWRAPPDAPSREPAAATSARPDRATAAPTGTSSSAPLRLLGRHEQPKVVFRTAWFVGPRRIIAVSRRRLHLFQVERRGPKRRLVSMRTVVHPEALSVHPTPEGAVDLMRVGHEPWIHVDRRVDQLFAGDVLAPKPDYRRDLSLSFPPLRLSRARTTKKVWALAERRGRSSWRVHVIERGESQIHTRLQADLDRSPSDIALSPHGQYLAVSLVPPQGGLHTVALYDVRKGRRLWRAASAGARFLRFSPSGKALVTGSRDGVVMCFDPVKRGEPRLLSSDQVEVPGLIAAHRGPLWRAAFDPTGRILITLSANGVASGTIQSVRCWDTRTWRELPAGRLRSRATPKGEPAVSPDGKLLLISGPGVLELRAFDADALHRR